MRCGEAADTVITQLCHCGQTGANVNRWTSLQGCLNQREHQFPNGVILSGAGYSLSPLDSVVYTIQLLKRAVVIDVGAAFVVELDKMYG